MKPEERLACAQIAIRHESDGNLSDAPQCPFLTTLIPNARCNKSSGVCSIRRFSIANDGFGLPLIGDKIVTVCPSRFLQPISGYQSLFGWIAEKMLDIDNPIIIKETPFLRKVMDNVNHDYGDRPSNEDESDNKKAGRIDWILVNPTTLESGELEWCAVETQALYFSGDKMRTEFDAYLAQPTKVLFPTGRRRPDYRSSGPKRLSPQLDVKVPVLRNWGKKVVIVVDRFFHDNMNSLLDAYPRARNDQERRDNADVVWFVVDFDKNMSLIPSTVIFTTLESSRRALNATEPLSKSDFTNELRSVIDNTSLTNKVFKPL